MYSAGLHIHSLDNKHHREMCVCYLVVEEGMSQVVYLLH